MNVWEQVVSAGIAGTRRRPDAVAGWEHDLGVEPEGAASGLDVMALLSVGRLAAPGLGPAVDLPEPVADARPAIPAAVFARVETDGPVGEMLAAAEQLDLAAPALAVPRLLEAAAAGRLPVGRVRTVTGPVGRFVAEQHPRWARLYGDAESDEADADWLAPDVQTRLRWLGDLRRRDPERARELVTQALDPRAEKPDFRAGLIALLADDEQDGDLPLLEAALDARAEAVREAAQRALVGRRGSSPLQSRMITRFRAWVRIVDGQFTVTLPPFTQAESRDGLIEGSKGVWNVGALAAAVPLEEWAAWGEPEQVVPALGRSGLPQLVDGLTRRILVEQERRWAQVCVEHRVVDAFTVRTLIPQDVLTERLNEAVARSRDPKAPPTTLSWVFAVDRAQLPASLASPLIQALPEVSAHHPSLARALARLLGEWADPGHARELSSVVGDCSAVVAQDAARAVALLTLRAWMHEQLNETARAAAPPASPQALSVGTPSQRMPDDLEGEQ